MPPSPRTMWPGSRAWMADVHIVTSTSAQATGREANGTADGGAVQAAPDTVYVRLSPTVDVIAAWTVASGRGEWTGRWTEPGRGGRGIGGTYLAQWRKVDSLSADPGGAVRAHPLFGFARYCARRP